MAGARTKRRTLTYREAHPIDGTWQFAELFEHLVTSRNKPARRIEELGPDGSGHHRVVSALRPLRKGFAGVLMEYDPGAPAAVIDIDVNAEEFKVNPQAPRTSISQYVRGMLYFYTQGNHVVLSPGAHFFEGNLESHAIWLLGNHCKKRDDMRGDAVKLIDKVPPTTKKRLAMVKGIKTKLQFRGPSTVGMTKRQIQVETSRLRAVLRALGDGAQSFLPSNVTLEDAIARDSLDVMVSIRHRGSVSDDGGMFLDSLATELRDVPDNAIEIDLADGTRITPRELRLRRFENIHCDAAGFPMDSAMHLAMAEWLQQLIADKQVS